jgi:L,D-peptidoglycan transpeptidase YkuD (ErfK/YbiS/YcfS/YnhG family)
MKRLRQAKTAQAAQVILRVLSPGARRGYVQFRGVLLPCALGKTGLRALKREGDGATPLGRFPLRYVMFRSGAARPKTALKVSAIRPHDGWCDGSADRNYNRRVKLPYPASSENLWRDDGLYDLVVVLGYNDVPRVRNRGSAIFMHIARAGFEPTEGCVALRARDLRRLLAMLPKRSEIVIQR